MHLAVETSGTQKRFVQVLGAVSRSHHDDSFRAVEAIHLSEQSVVGLLKFTVLVLFATLSKAVDFVDENDRRFRFTSLRKQFADSFRPYPNIDLVEITSAR